MPRVVINIDCSHSSKFQLQGSADKQHLTLSNPTEAFHRRTNMSVDIFFLGGGERGWIEHVLDVLHQTGCWPLAYVVTQVQTGSEPTRMN